MNVQRKRRNQVFFLIQELVLQFPNFTEETANLRLYFRKPIA